MLKKRFTESMILLCAISLLLLEAADTKDNRFLQIQSAKTDVSNRRNGSYSCQMHSLTEEILKISQGTLADTVLTPLRGLHHGVPFDFAIPTVRKENSQYTTTPSEPLSAAVTPGDAALEPTASKEHRDKTVTPAEPDSPQSPSETEAVKAEEAFAAYDMYTNSYVDLKERADANSATIATLEPNTALKVTGEDGSWRSVQLDAATPGYLEVSRLSAEETPIEALNRWGIALSAEETDLLADIVFLEAGIDSLVGKEAVIETIFNRVSSASFPSDLYSVLSQKGQFSTWPLLDRAAPGSEEYQAIHDVVYGATYILDPEYVYFSRRKANGYDFIKIGKHWFGRE